ncbi:HNH endonuclease signature motif containing protein [Nanoarchaeota archaeon]
MATEKPFPQIYDKFSLISSSIILITTLISIFVFREGPITKPVLEESLATASFSLILIGGCLYLFRVIIYCNREHQKKKLEVRTPKIYDNISLIIFIIIAIAFIANKLSSDLIYMTSEDVIFSILAVIMASFFLTLMILYFRTYYEEKIKNKDKKESSDLEEKAKKAVKAYYEEEGLEFYSDADEFDDELIDRVIKNNFNVRKTYEQITEEQEVEEEIQKIKERERKFKIKQKAEKKHYGKVKSKRHSLSEEEKDTIFAKFDNKCAICAATEGLHIHHKDRDPKNNRISNLIVLCGVCHKKIHMKVR